MSNKSSEKFWLNQNLWASIAVFFILGILIFGGPYKADTNKQNSHMKMEQSSSATQ